MWAVVPRSARWGRHPGATLDIVYGLPVDTDLSAFVGLELQLVSISLHQVNADFDGVRKIGISIEGDYAVAPAGMAQVRYTAAPDGAAAPASLLGSQVAGVRVAEPGTTSVHFAGGATITVFDSEAHYESYQIYISERIIVV